MYVRNPLSQGLKLNRNNEKAMKDASLYGERTFTKARHGLGGSCPINKQAGRQAGRQAGTDEWEGKKRGRRYKEE